MADVLNKEQRSRCMSAIRSKNTKPELIVRRTAHRLGFRYRLHDKKLPGKPDLVFPRFRKIILVHGCFWHMHDCKYGAVVPRTRAEFWKKKRRHNTDRDEEVRVQLQELGWDVLVLWECQVKDSNKLEYDLLNFLRV